MDAPGAWRAKVVAGQLWVKYIHMKGQWKERASILRMLLALAPSLPDVDVVYVSSDADPSPSLAIIPSLKAIRFVRLSCETPWSRQMPVLTNAVEYPSRLLQGSLPGFHLGGLAASAAMVPAEPALGTRWPFAVGVAQGFSILSRLTHQRPSPPKIGSPVAQRGRQAHAERESRHACAHRYALSVPGFENSSRLLAARVRQHHYPRTASWSLRRVLPATAP